MYAMVLAPRDNEVRWMAVRQLLLEGKLDDAKRALGPIAFDPHAGTDKDKAEEVLSAIESGNPAKGVAVIDKVERDWKQL
jgi:hypothetical protein